MVPTNRRRGLAAGVVASSIIILQWLAIPSLGLAQYLNRPPAKLPNPGINLVIRVDKPVFEVSTPVIVHVELSNASQLPFR